MASRRAASASAHLLLVFLCGGAAYASASHALWATAFIAALAAVLIVAPSFGHLTGAGANAVSPPPAAAPADLARERERRTLGHFIDHAPVPLLVQDPAGGLRARNRAARRLFSAADLVPSPPEALVSAVRRAQPGERQVLTLALTGAPRVYAVSVADVSGGEGSTRLVALTDIQAELQAAEAAALREILQVLSHEIMNSLTPVVSLAETARGLLSEGDPEASALAGDAVKTLARRTEGLLHFVEAYRALARLPAPRLSAVPLTPLLEDVARLFRSRWSQKGVELILRSPDVQITLRADADLLPQALLNLMTNGAEAALEASDRAPCVELGARLLPHGGVEITVADNGIGLGGNDPALLVRPFHTTKPNGTGLGLSLARQIVAGHGGDLELRSPGLEGAGAVAAVRL